MVATPSQTDTYSTALDIFDRTHPLRVDSDENLKVTIEGSSGRDIGTVDQGAPGAQPWLVAENPSINAIGSEETVFTVKTPLLATNLGRKGLIIQTNNSPVAVWFGDTLVPTYRLPTNAILEVENFLGAVFGSVTSGSSTIIVTEKI